MPADPIPPIVPIPAAAAPDAVARLLLDSDAMPWMEMVQGFSAAGLWRNDLTTYRCLWSPQMFELYGLPPTLEAPDLETWVQVVVPEDRERVRALCQPDDGIGHGFDIEYRIRHARLGERWMHAIGRVAARDAEGHPLVINGMTMDVTVRHEAQRALARSEQRYRWLLDNATDVMWRFDLDRPIDTRLPADEQIRLIYERAFLAECNPAMSQMYGFPSTREMLGARLPDLMPPSESANVAYLTAFIEGGYRIRDAESVERTADGRVIHVSNNLVGMVEDGLLVCGWGTSRDITREREWEQQMREADARKDEFLAVLAHELRNPLAPVRTALDLWRVMAPSDPRLLWARDVATRQIEHMTRLVDDLLDISRIRHGMVRLQLDALDLRDVLDEVVETFRPMVRQRAQTLEAAVAPGPFPVHADRTRLVQAIGNLVDNASKFSPDGVALQIIAERDGAEAKLRVRDPGRGIAAGDLPHVFDIFVQSASSTGGERRGLGIGLTLVRALVELHGGRVSVASEGEGRGTDVDVWLPLATVALATPSAAVPAPAPPSPPSGTRVLIVDDNIDAAQSLAMLLGLRGYDVQTAFSGREAVLAAGATRPHAVLLDIGLPDTDGYDVARQLRATPWGRDVALVALTGFGQDDDRAKAAEAGFDRHLTKPVAPQTLETCLAEVVAARAGA